MLISIKNSILEKIRDDKFFRSISTFFFFRAVCLHLEVNGVVVLLIVDAAGVVVVVDRERLLTLFFLSTLHIICS